MDSKLQDIIWSAWTLNCEGKYPRNNEMENVWNFKNSPDKVNVVVWQEKLRYFAFKFVQKSKDLACTINILLFFLYPDHDVTTGVAHVWKGHKCID